MNDEIKAKAYDNLKWTFEYQCDEIKKLRLSNRISWGIIICSVIATIFHLK